jgi:hypothetical protein
MKRKSKPFQDKPLVNRFNFKYDGGVFKVTQNSRKHNELLNAIKGEI